MRNSRKNGQIGQPQFSKHTGQLPGGANGSLDLRKAAVFEFERVPSNIRGVYRKVGE